MSADIVVPSCAAVECTLALASVLPLFPFPLLPRCTRPMSYVPVPVPVPIQLPVDDDGDVSGFLEHRPPRSASASVFALPDRHHPCVTSLRLSCSCPACCVSTSCISMPCSIAHHMPIAAQSSHVSYLLAVAVVVVVVVVVVFISYRLFIIIFARTTLDHGTILDCRRSLIFLFIYRASWHHGIMGIMGGYRPLLGTYVPGSRYARANFKGDTHMYLAHVFLC